MSKKIIFLLAIVLLALVFVAFFIYIYYFSSTMRGPIYNDVIFPGREQKTSVKVNDEDYKKELKQAISNLLIDPSNRQTIINVREKILALQVPAEYRQLHLDLVIALTHLEQENTLAQGQEELNGIIKDNEWLK